MSSGSYNSVNKDDDDDDEYGQGYRQFPSSYNDSQQHQQQQQQQESMTPQPSVGRFTEKEKQPTTMFSRKPATPKTSQDSSASPSNTSGIVNLRAPPRAEDKMNKRKK